MIKSIKNKKASVGSTLTWAAAVFVIVMIMVIYFVFLGVIYAKKGLSELKLTSEYKTYEITAMKQLVQFLESPSGLADGSSIYDILLKAGSEDVKESERKEMYKTKAKEFLLTTFSGGTEISPDYSVWIRVYPAEKEAIQFPTMWGIDKIYQAEIVSSIQQTSDLCIPDKTSMVIILPLENSKKLVLCAHKNAEK